MNTDKARDQRRKDAEQALLRLIVIVKESSLLPISTELKETARENHLLQIIVNMAETKYKRLKRQNKSLRWCLLIALITLFSHLLLSI